MNPAWVSSVRRGRQAGSVAAEVKRAVADRRIPRPAIAHASSTDLAAAPAPANVVPGSTPRLQFRRGPRGQGSDHPG